MFAGASIFWLCAPPALAITVGKYLVMIIVLALLSPCGIIHDQQPRFLNSLLVTVTLNDISSTAMIAVPQLWNVPSEMLTRLYPVLILLVFNHTSVLFYIFSFIGILLQLFFTSAIPIIAIPSLIIVFSKVSNLCWIGWSDVLPIPPMFWNMVLILPSLFPLLSWWTQSLWQFLLGFQVWFSAYLSEVVQEDAGRAQGPWAPSPVPGSVSFWVITVIVLSISVILDFRVSASASSDALGSLSLLRVAFNYWVSNDISCFAFDALVWPVLVEALRNASPCGYTSPLFKEACSRV